MIPGTLDQEEAKCIEPELGDFELPEDTYIEFIRKVSMSDKKFEQLTIADIELLSQTHTNLKKADVITVSEFGELLDIVFGRGAYKSQVAK